MKLVRWGATLVWTIDVHRKREEFSLSLYLRSHQGGTPLSPIWLSLFFVSFVHPRCDVTSQLFSLKRRGASNPKKQTYTSSLPALFACARWMLHDQTKQSYNNCVDTIFFLGKMNGLTSLLSLTSATSPAVKKLLGWKQVTRFFMNSHLSRLSAARGYSTRFFQVGPIKV